MPGWRSIAVDTDQEKIKQEAEKKKVFFFSLWASGFPPGPLTREQPAKEKRSEHDPYPSITKPSTESWELRHKGLAQPPGHPLIIALPPLTLLDAYFTLCPLALNPQYLFLHCHTLLMTLLPPSLRKMKQAEEHARLPPLHLPPNPQSFVLVESRVCR